MFFRRPLKIVEILILNRCQKFNIKVFLHFFSAFFDIDSTSTKLPSGYALIEIQFCSTRGSWGDKIFEQLKMNSTLKKLKIA